MESQGGKVGPKKNAVRSVRLLDADAALLESLSGLDAAAPFTAKANAALRRLGASRASEREDLRLLIREELGRFLGGMN